MDAQQSTLDYYSQHFHDFTESTLNVDMTPVYEHFLPLLRQGANILDAGCGAGRDAKHFQALGYQVDAFDASPELAAFASDLLQQPVPVMTFQTFDKTDKYDGIWCCASLLHVPKDELTDVVRRLSNALRTSGIAYISFKYGVEERMQNGRFFCDQNEHTFAALVSPFPELSVIETWITGDQRPDRAHERWLNVILKKTAHRGQDTVLNHL